MTITRAMQSDRETFSSINPVNALVIVQASVFNTSLSALVLSCKFTLIDAVSLSTTLVLIIYKFWNLQQASSTRSFNWKENKDFKVQFLGNFLKHSGNEKDNRADKDREIEKKMG